MKLTWLENAGGHALPPTCWTTTAIRNDGGSVLYRRSFANEARVSIARERNGTVVSTIVGSVRSAWIIGFISLVIQERKQDEWSTVWVIQNQFAYHTTCHFYRTRLPGRDPESYRAYADFFRLDSAGAHRERVGSWENRGF